MRVGILGGGLTGLTLANLLRRHDVEVLEAYSRPGGLCRSFEWQGFRGDFGQGDVLAVERGIAVREGVGRVQHHFTLMTISV